jgi:hypothetical protein
MVISSRLWAPLSIIGVSYARDPAEDAEMHRRIRNEIFDTGGYPYGDRRVNPQRKRTAYDYHEWARKQKSHSINEGSYLDMLESEERHIGQTSYPAGHPRRERAVSGLPSGPEVSPDAGPTRPAEGAPSSNMDRLLRSGANDRVPVRPNRFTAQCANCGGEVAPGEGRMERQPTQWITVHHPSCPS